MFHVPCFMSYVLVGLGNPGKEYENTRHNTGRFMLEEFAKVNDFPEWVFDKKLNALVSKGSPLSSSKVNGQMSIVLFEPETFMNKSGETVGKLKDLRFKIKGKGKEKIKEIQNLAVIHDDLDIPFGKFKISFNKSSGGHRGVESVIKALKTKAFIRIRVGISLVTPSGKLKKPKGEVAVDKHILGRFSPDQLIALKKLSKKISEGLAVIITKGREKAMNQQRSF